MHVSSAGKARRSASNFAYKRLTDSMRLGKRDTFGDSMRGGVSVVGFVGRCCTVSIFYSDTIGNVEMCHYKKYAAYCVTVNERDCR